ncbi:trypsin-like serine protease [Pantoea ananatis]|uniref:trypsin-like serine protease n=1 Tax=Pantoea ananas TaxID=553 RepID=UPI0023B137F0|nr:trypsin-like serine protease [Pantoea ananatis]
MFDDYVCKIYVSTEADFTKVLEATAFGFNDGKRKKILTAAHVVTNVLGKTYPDSNSVQLYVKFKNHYGEVNSTPILVSFILNNCNNNTNFINSDPFVDSAEIVLPEEVSHSISKFFRGIPTIVVGVNVSGLGYPLGEDKLTILPGEFKQIDKLNCPKHYNERCITSRLMVDHDSRPGCSGGPYVTKVGDEYFVIGSLIGLVDGCDPSVNPHVSIQSASDF